nr:hypothetical protein [Tanacetum cinerariifolium]
MELCTNLQLRVLTLEKTKTTQALEIDSLKRRVKKLEKKQRSRTHKLKRLYKVGLTARIDSSEDEPSLGEDTNKQGRKINDIDVDEDITIVNAQDDAKMFDEVGEEVVKDSNTTKLSVDDAHVNAAGELNAASITTNLSATATITTEEVTLAKAHAELKASKPKDKGKGIMVEEPVKPKKNDQVRLDEEVTLKLQAKFDEEE